jgi:hypothetical protein
LTKHGEETLFIDAEGSAVWEGAQGLIVSGCQACYALWAGYEEREVISQVSMRVSLCLAVRLATLSGLDMRRESLYPR